MTPKAKPNKNQKQDGFESMPATEVVMVMKLLELKRTVQTSLEFKPYLCVFWTIPHGAVGWDAVPGGVLREPCSAGIKPGNLEPPACEACIPAR